MRRVYAFIVNGIKDHIKSVRRIKNHSLLTRNVPCPHSPFSVQSQLKTKVAEDGKENTTQRRLILENGHPGVEVNEAAVRRGENIYTKYYQQQGEQPSNGQVCPLEFPINSPQLTKRNLAYTTTILLKCSNSAGLNGMSFL